MTPFSALAVALVVVLCAMQAHGQVTGYTMTNANIRVAVHECALESQVGETTSTHDCSRVGRDYWCDATFDCPNSQATYGPIETWDTSRVTCLTITARDDQPDACSTETGHSLIRDGLFNNMRGFNKPIGHWNTAAVTLFAGVFNLAGAFNQPLHWDVGAAETFRAMFSGCGTFNQDLSHWTPSTALVDASYMFSSSAMDSDVRDSNGDPWGITGVSTSGMYSSTCLSQRDQGQGERQDNIRLGAWLCPWTPANCDTLTCGTGTTLRADPCADGMYSSTCARTPGGVPLTRICARSTCDVVDQDTCCEASAPGTSASAPDTSGVARAAPVAVLALVALLFG